MALNPHDSSVDQRSHVVSPGSANQPTARLAFRWRIIPATVCFMFGPLFIFAGILAAARLYGNFCKNLESIDDLLRRQESRLVANRLTNVKHLIDANREAGKEQRRSHFATTHRGILLILFIVAQDENGYLLFLRIDNPIL